MKQIIQRALPLNTKYILVDKKYIPLEQSAGAYCCDNCGKLIANIATVKSENGKYDIGFDCLETILINNSLLSTNDIKEYEAAKRMIPKILRFAKEVKETVERNKGFGINVTGMHFEKQAYVSDYYTFWWLRNNELKSRDNSYVKMKEMKIEFLIETLKNIFPQLNIIYP